MKRGIEVEFQRFYNVLLGKCNYIPDELRGQLYLRDEETRYEISSDNEPRFYDDMSLSICGTKKEKDDLNFCYAYDTYEEAIEARKVFQKLIYQFNEQYCKEQILDDAEKEYLENMLKPFKNRNFSIEKVPLKDKEKFAYLKFYFHDTGINGVCINDDFYMPVFTANKCYNGMKYGEWYSKEKLGLFEEA